jgi:hypothetical protein
MKKGLSAFWSVIIFLAVALVLGQALSYFITPNSWQAFLGTLPVVVSQIAFWGPIVAIIAAFMIWIILRLLGFSSLEEIRKESVEQNNPTPAIIFVGTMIASIIFLILVIRP